MRRIPMTKPHTRIVRPHRSVVVAEAIASTIHRPRERDRAQSPSARGRVTLAERAFGMPFHGTTNWLAPVCNCAFGLEW